jgi:hypothetical protein
VRKSRQIPTKNVQIVNKIWRTDLGLDAFLLYLFQQNLQGCQRAVYYSVKWSWQIIRYHSKERSNAPYFLTPCSRVLLEKLTCLKLVKKFPAFYGNRRFTIAFTSARHRSLPWARSIQSIPPHPTSWRSALTLSYRLRLGLPTKKTNFWDVSKWSNATEHNCNWR